MKIALIRHQANLGRIEFAEPCPQALTPTFKIRFVVRHEVSESQEPFGGRRWIEDDLNQPEKTIILDNNNRTKRRHRA
jgi:hypothetical protein